MCCVTVPAEMPCTWRWSMRTSVLQVIVTSNPVLCAQHWFSLPDIHVPGCAVYVNHIDVANAQAGQAQQVLTCV
jgi:hypothetical protein